MVNDVYLLTGVDKIKLHSKSILFCVFICLSTSFLQAQPAEYKMSRKEYIEKYREEAIKEMLANNIPASITLAQALLESGDGNSPLARYANNHFGIKCHKTWQGPTFIQDDDEKNECFRKYYTVYDSYKDHSDFLRTRSWYAPLFKLKTTDYKGWAYGLKKAGYATHPKYAELLITLIEDNKLYEYDKLKEISGYKQQSNPIVVNKLDSVRGTVELRNNIKYIVAKPGDTAFKIADSFQMGLWQIYKYNDLSREEKLKPGEIIYLQPKRNEALEEYHIVKKGETMRSVSQLYGIKLKKLYWYNHMNPGEEVKDSDILYLRKRKYKEVNLFSALN